MRIFDMDRRKFIQVTSASTVIALTGVVRLNQHIMASGFKETKKIIRQTNMKTGILYMTKHGTTEKVANMIRAGLDYPDNVELIDLKKVKDPDISLFETVIIGGSIHAGTIQQGVKKFCLKNMHVLLTKKVGIYLCCMEEGDKAIMQFENAYPVELRKHSISKEIMGGEFLFEKMNFLEKAVVKKVSGYSESVSKIKTDAVDQFTADIYSN